MKTAPERAAAYLAKLPPAVSGQGGHNATLRAACELARFGLGDAEAMAILSNWNRTHCQPPWTDRELAHKWQSARAKVGTASRLVPACPAVRVVWGVPPRSRPGAEASKLSAQPRLVAELQNQRPERPTSPVPFIGQALQNYLNQRPSIPRHSVLRG